MGFLTVAAVFTVLCTVGWFYRDNLLLWLSIVFSKALWKHFMKTAVLDKQHYDVQCREWISADPKRLKAERKISDGNGDSDDELQDEDASGVTDLSPFDCYQARMTINNFFVYNSRLDENKLKSSLATVLSEFPQFGGTILSRNKNRTLYIAHHSPVVEFIVGRPRSTTPSNSNSNSTRNTQKRKNGKSLKPWKFTDVTEFAHYFEECSTSLPFQSHTALLKITLTHLDDKSSMLAVSSNHGVADGSGFFLFMKAWSAHVRGEHFEIPCHNRKSLIISESEGTSISPIEPHEVGWSISPAVYLACEREIANRTHKFMWHRFLFTPVQIQFLVEYARNGSASMRLEGRRVSANDVLCALFWKLGALLHPEETLYHLNIYVDLRRFTKRVNSNYFGVAIKQKTIEASRNKVKDLELSELVFWIRCEIDALSETTAEMETQFLNQQLQKHGIDSLTNLESRGMMRGLTVTNLSRFGGYEVDFGVGRPKLVCRVFTEIPPLNLAYIYPHATDVGGYDFRVVFPSSVHNLLASVDSSKDDYGLALLDAINNSKPGR